MKKYEYIILVCITCLSFSCKTNSSSISSIGVSTPNGIYYYKSCTIKESGTYLCKFKCNEDTDISLLRLQNIEDNCPTLVGAIMDYNVGESFNLEKFKNITSLIRNLNTLNIITIDYDEFSAFDNMFSQYGGKSYGYGVCHSECIEPAGTIFNIWKKYKKDSTIIYQNYTPALIGGLQWVVLSKKNTDGNNTSIIKTYKKAKKACENYEFDGHKDWSLPKEVNLVEAIKLELGETIFNDTHEDLSVWTIEGKVYNLMRESKEIQPKQFVKGSNPEQGVICSRIYELFD